MTDHLMILLCVLLGILVFAIVALVKVVQDLEKELKNVYLSTKNLDKAITIGFDDCDHNFDAIGDICRELQSTLNDYNGTIDHARRIALQADNELSISDEKITELKKALDDKLFLGCDIAGDDKSDEKITELKKALDDKLFLESCKPVHPDI